MVVAPQAPAVESGIEVLRRGGNAFDAAVTTALAQTVVDPQNCGIAGFGVANLRAADGRHVVIDFNATAGSRVRPEMWRHLLIEQDWTGYGYHLEGQVNDVGYQSIMTPGTVAGLAEVLRRFGTISWAEALEPAIALAEQGFLVSPELWRLWNQPAVGERLSMRERIGFTPASRALYIKPDGETWRPGERLRNPDYARVLRRLASAGPEDFYTGELAQRMAEDLEANGAFVTAADLANYRVRVVEPLWLTYRGYELATNPPAGGGVCLAEILKIVEHEDLAALGLNTVEYITLVARAMQAAYADWYSVVGDPAFVDVPVERLLSSSHIQERYQLVRSDQPIAVPRRVREQGTTHVTVIDSAGNVASITHSLGSSSGIVTPGLGFTYNNCMNAADPIPDGPNAIAPGKARITGMCPTIGLKRGEAVFALGAPGGTRIITGVLQATLNLVDHGLTPVEAVSAPRFDCQSEILDCEARIPSWVRAALADRGFRVVENPALYGNFARVQLIARDPLTGQLRGGADPRSGGVVLEV
jgi:gamma-glutamyltranspeptidase/glutathione hydrolase